MKDEIPGAMYEPDDSPDSQPKRNPESQPVSVEELDRIPFFHGLSAEHLAQVARYSKRSHFEAEQAMLRQGDLANRFYIITSGRVLLEYNAGGKMVPIQDLRAGDPLGFSWFFSPDNLHFTATAQTPVEAIFFYGALLREECDFDPALGYELMRRTGEVMLRRMEAISAKLAQAISI